MQVLRAQGADRVALADTGLATDWRGNSAVSLRGDAVKPKSQTRDQQIRGAALFCFSESYSGSLLCTLRAKEWIKLLHWLDVSGLALYFLDRMAEIHQRSSLPAWVVNRLERSLEENRERTSGLIEESARLQQDFQSRDLSYAVMKGLSLCPVSVSRLELRHQFDLDFLIASSDAPAAKEILGQHGYTLFAISGKSWEFKKGQTPRVCPRDLYRDLPYRGVELHLDVDTPGSPTRLDRAVKREMHGLMMPVLSPVHLFVGQAMHASKDIASPFLRASHLFEFHRHVLAQRDDISFWQKLHLHAREDRRACVAIGMVTYLAESVWGNFAPQALTSWTVEQLPPSVRLWLDLYGRDAAIQAPPGNKRYLWLREELVAAGCGAALRSRKTRSVPFRLPPAVIQAIPGEALSTRVARYLVQIRFVASRVRFHVVEGLRFIVESRRWHKFRSSLP
ncbi:MAG TPA: nucleotidyltransferase family protein [Acidobacteriaceae bacterium]|nr:nucleotidyltransferase family protein [Acidobacteriaceae bacterium]